MEKAENTYFKALLDQWQKQESSEKENSSGEEAGLTNALKFFMYSLSRKNKLTDFLKMLCKYSGNTQDSLSSLLHESSFPEVHIDSSRPNAFESGEYIPFLFLVSSHVVYADIIYQDMQYFETDSWKKEFSGVEAITGDHNFWIYDNSLKSLFLLECRKGSSNPGMRRLYSLITGSSGLDISEIAKSDFTVDNIITVTWKQIYLSLCNHSFSKGSDEELAFLIEKMKISLYNAGVIKEPAAP